MPNPVLFMSVIYLLFFSISPLISAFLAFRLFQVFLFVFSQDGGAAAVGTGAGSVTVVVVGSTTSGGSTTVVGVTVALGTILDGSSTHSPVK